MSSKYANKNSSSCNSDWITLYWPKENNKGNAWSWPTLAKPTLASVGVLVVWPTLAKPTLTCGVVCCVWCVCVCMCAWVLVSRFHGVVFHVWVLVSRFWFGRVRCPREPSSRDRPSRGPPIPGTALPGTALPGGHARIWPNRIWPELVFLVFWPCVCVSRFWVCSRSCVCVVCGVFKIFWWVSSRFLVGVFKILGPLRAPPPPRPPPPLDGPSAGPPKISLFFFSLSRRKFHSFFSLWVVFSLNFGGVFEGRGAQLCTFGL